MLKQTILSPAKPSTFPQHKSNVSQAKPAQQQENRRHSRPTRSTSARSERDSMVETNLRIVEGGPDLDLRTRIVKVDVVRQGENEMAELLNKACAALRRRYKLAAVRQRDGSLAVLTSESISSFPLHTDDWELEIEDTRKSRLLSLCNSSDVEPMLRLLSRSLHIEVEQRTGKWNLDSRRQWYDAQPFAGESGIGAYNRIALGSVWVQDVGAAISADVETAYFSGETLDWFIACDLSASESQGRRRWLDELTGRDEGRKGTLLYDNGEKILSCYLADTPKGLTCGTTKAFSIDGKRYSSLLDYYRKKFPQINVQADTPAVMVSFRGMSGGSVPVAATRLRARVFNENLPHRLSQAAIVSPEDRRNAILSFWNELGEQPLGHLAPDLEHGFWRPDESRVWQIPHPALAFAKDRVMPAPAPHFPQQVKGHYRRRKELLEDGGCHRFPPATPRTLRCLAPHKLDEEMVAQLAADVCALLSNITDANLSPEIVRYKELEAGIAHLKNIRDPGVALWVMDKDPNSYYEIELRLPNWRPKRVTEAVLNEKWSDYRNGKWDRKARQKTAQAGEQSWESFVIMTAFDVLQKMDALPYRIAESAPYEAALVIDVHHDRRFFAFSLWVSRDPKLRPDVLLETHVCQKTDSQETINAVYLERELRTFLGQVCADACHPLESLLVLRDGKWCGDEHATIKAVIEEFVSPDAVVDLAEFHKDSNKELRLWQIDDNDGKVCNVWEGTVVEVSERMAVLCNTGEATLSGRTAHPVVLHNRGEFALRKAAQMSFYGAQLNFSSPGVAQRLPLPLKRTDEELEARAQQEVRKHK